MGLNINWEFLGWHSSGYVTRSLEMFCYSFVTQTIGASPKDCYFHKKKEGVSF
jgi:hypothetical protein